MLLLQVARVDTPFAMDGRLFHNVALLQETFFYLLEDIFSGNLRSVAVHVGLYKELVELVTAIFNCFLFLVPFLLILDIEISITNAHLGCLGQLPFLSSSRKGRPKKL